MKVASLAVLPLTMGLSGCLSYIEPDFEAKRALYNEVMLNGEVLGNNENSFTIRYERKIYTCYNFTGFCVVM